VAYAIISSPVEERGPWQLASERIYKLPRPHLPLECSILERVVGVTPLLIPVGGLEIQIELVFLLQKLLHPESHGPFFVLRVLGLAPIGV